MTSDPKIKTPPISVSNAILHAMQGLDIKYDQSKKGPNGVDLSKAISEIEATLNSPTLKDEYVEAHLDKAKASYNEVKAATEYQDQKAARLLTILAFLTAAAATIFAKFIDIYSIQSPDRSTFAETLICAIYFGFTIYFLVIAVGALTTFYATQTRFTIPEESGFQSLLFFKGVLSYTPNAWGGEFVASKAVVAKKYFVNYVVETYLIALKTSVKVQYLRPAQAILQFAIKILLVVIVLLAFTLLTVPRDAKNQGKHDTNEVVTNAHNASANESAPPQAVALKPSAKSPDATPVATGPGNPVQAPTTHAGTNVMSHKPAKDERPSGT